MDSSNPARQSEPLHGMFTVVPPRYDMVNRIISLGLDKRWRRLAASVCLEGKPRRILDLGCGTGDLSIEIARMSGGNAEITGLDYSLPMLERARRKAARAGVEKRVNFVHGQATQIPFPDGHFDCVGISFAFRNLTYKNPLRQPHLAEVKRALKSGGRYVIVESSQPENRLIRALFHFYVKAIVGPVGTLLSGNKGAYRYLTESMTKFHTPADVGEMLSAVGFKTVSYHPLFYGAAGIHIAAARH